ncbi:MAG TPA: hypothetical protein VHG35_11735, partial [Gemmatimonadales bacterium]|nr:hypothetical protein [Gemmatimonadales bacterium]
MTMSRILRCALAACALLAAGCDHPTAGRTGLAPAPGTASLQRTVERLAGPYAAGEARLPSSALPADAAAPAGLRWLTPEVAEAAARAHSAELSKLV